MFPGRITPIKRVIGIINKAVDITDEFPTTKAASIPILTSLPPIYFAVNSFVASATGVRPSINNETILGIIFSTAAICTPNVNIAGTSYPANAPMASPITNPITIGSPTTPNFS